MKINKAYQKPEVETFIAVSNEIICDSWNSIIAPPGEIAPWNDPGYWGQGSGTSDLVW